METLIKTRKPRTKKEVNPQIAALKKSVSAALKAAWNVEAVKARKEKAVRKERGTLEKKVQEQREALKAIKASVDAFLVALTPEAGITPEPQSVLDDPATVVLDPSAAA
jgi:DNA-binding transcriptional regulator WhiA